MDRLTMRQVIENEDKLIIEAYHGSEQAEDLLWEAYDAGYVSKYATEDCLEEGWSEFKPRNNILHPVKAIKNMWDSLRAKRQKKKINKLTKKLQKDIDDYQEASKLGADEETLNNIKDRYKKAGGDELDDRLTKYRKHRLNILNRNSGKAARDDYKVYDDEGNEVKSSALINDKSLNKGMKTDKDFDEMLYRNSPYYKNKHDKDEKKKKDEPQDVPEDEVETKEEPQSISNTGPSAKAEEPKEKDDGPKTISDTGRSSSSDDPTSGNYDSHAKHEEPESEEPQEEPKPKSAARREPDSKEDESVSVNSASDKSADDYVSVLRGKWKKEVEAQAENMNKGGTRPTGSSKKSKDRAKAKMTESFMALVSSYRQMLQE